MTTFSTPAATGRFDLGGVVGEAWAAFRANFASFFLISLILLGTPTLLRVLLTPRHPAPGALPAAGLLIFLVQLVLGAVQQAAVVRGTVLYETGRPTGWRPLLSAVGPVVATVVLVTLVYVLAVVLGCVLLLVPGLFLATAWGVAVPVAATERLGVAASLRRSWTLTAGHRWGVFAAFILIGLVVVGISLAGGLVGGLFAVLGGGPVVTLALTAILAALLQGVVGAFSSAGLATVYTHLRRAKEGITPAALAAVFD